MTAPTGAELALLRTQPHYTKLYLSVFKPQTVFAAQVSGTVVKGDQEIPYDNVTIGNYLAIGAGMTLYAGSTQGDTDKGSIFVFSRDSSIITVGENSHINWQDNDYISVVNYHQIWPVYPRYVQDGEDITVYKIYSVAYTNQNEDLGSFLVMGGNYAGFLNTATGTCSVYYDASDSENVYGTTGSTYSWSFEGGTPTGSTSITPGYITYGTAGHYRTLLRIQTPIGNADVGVRHVSIYDKPGVGPNNPILVWGIDSLTGSRDAGGYRARVWVEQNFGDIVDGALVVIFAEDTYGTTIQSIGGNATNRQTIVFSGYILDGSIDYDYEHSRVSFDVGSPTDIMKYGEAFSVSVEDSRNPIQDAEDKGGDPWFYLKDLTVKRAIYHYLRWHSSAYTLCDIRYVGDDFPIQFFDANRDSLYDAVNTFIRNTAFGKAVCDRQGALYFEIDAEAIDSADTVLPTNMFIDSHDWINRPSITEKTIPEVSYIEAGGVAYSGSTGTFSPILCAAPGIAPAYRGRNEKISGLALISQEQTNTLIGNIYAARNARYPSTRLDIAGNYRNFDIAPQEIVRLTLHSDDTYRGISWGQKPFVIQGIDWTYDPKVGLFKPAITIAEITQGFAADTVAIPEVPPDEGYDNPPPPPVIPPIPIFPGLGGNDVFVQVMAGYNYTLSTPTYPGENNAFFPGIRQNDTDDIEGFTTFRVAAEGTVILTPILGISAFGGGLDIIAISVAKAYPNLLGFSSQDNTGQIAITMPTFANTTVWAITELATTLTVSVGDMVLVYMRRIGSSGLDTYLGSINLLGWSIS